MIMSEQVQEQAPEGYGVDYTIITFNLDPKMIVRNMVIVTATAILTKSVIDVGARQLFKLTRKLKTRAIDEAHKKVESKISKEDNKNQ